ncbi:Methyltransferase domain [Rhizoctonia solani]|uniref:Methyltransferase domain n=1 Tax=Rhizoctonia solani TaxID=456999 RepID=A0A8H7HF18_9AGAM|nr:Methyltransferase domain [Rhizoctonia solani]KAF8754988.1 Methyltransferase domain [Rhizoctonia solani]
MPELNHIAKRDWKPDSYNRAVNFVYSEEYTKPVFDLLSAQPGERIVDLGCGTGELTVRLKQLVGKEGDVFGVDASESMLERAKKNGIRHVFRSDAQNLVIPEEFNDIAGTFDAVFTNAALHWCKQDPRGAVRTAKTLLKPGGRFVGELGGHMNGLGLRCAISQVLTRRGKAAVDPWFLPQPSEYTKILESEGFRVEHTSLNPRVTILPGTLADFVRALFCTSYFKDIGDEEMDDMIEEVSRLIFLRWDSTIEFVCVNIKGRSLGFDHNTVKKTRAGVRYGAKKGSECIHPGIVNVRHVVQL